MWNSKLGELLTKLYDYRIFSKYSFDQSKLHSKENFEAFITKQYHIIEKGMALPAPRKGFGKDKINILIDIVRRYEERFGADQLTSYVRAVLSKYLERNGEYIDQSFTKNITEFLVKQKFPLAAAGVKKLSLEDIESATSFDYEGFIKSRSSVRNFSTIEVEIDEIKKAVEIARHTPSVCNRQSWKVYLYTGPLMQKLLKLQGGNQGFSESVDKLLIVTTDIRKFTKMESNQVYIDGGLFSMSLLLALHHQKIASCCLNTCKPFTDENEICQVAGIPDYERVIMMIAIGKYQNQTEVAFSPKKNADEILQIH